MRVTDTGFFMFFIGTGLRLPDDWIGLFFKGTGSVFWFGTDQTDWTIGLLDHTKMLALLTT